MAKLNYEKLNQLQKADRNREKGTYVGKDFTWTLKGKYTFIPVRQLPLDYLIWASENLQPGEHKAKADKELVRRYKKIST